MGAEQTAEGSAGIHGPLWGARARDWAELQEPLQRPLYEAGIRLTGLGPGASVLDVGCGCGLFCRLAADAGASVSGIDASAPSVGIASERTPEGDFRVGELQVLPFGDAGFDAVTGFNSFQFAADPRAALIEARRVAKPDAPVFMVVWGREERTELVVLLEALAPLLPPAPPGAAGPFALSEGDALEELAHAAGLSAKEGGYLAVPFEYPSEEAIVRAALSSGGGVRAIAEAGERAVREALTERLRPFRRADGSYRLETEWRYLLTLA